MARFSVGGGEDGNEDRSIIRPIPKRFRSIPPILDILLSPAINHRHRPTASDGRILRRVLPEVESVMQRSTNSGLSLSDTSTDSSSMEEEAEEEGEGEGEGIQQTGGEVQLDEARADLIDERKNGSISVTLSDPDVLDCPICYDPLCSPVYQCENGHISCASCCSTMKNTCANCCWPIGYNRCRAIEKVLDSVKITCTNMPHGCKETLSYSKKHAHENACTYTPCSCPHLGCDYVGISKSVYAHFALKHFQSSELFHFNDDISISLDKNQKFAFLQERILNTLFIINHSVETVGSFVNVVCVAPTSEKGAFLYDLTATVGENSVKLKSSVEIMPKWVLQPPKNIYLIVPSHFISSSGQLELELTIWKNPVYTN